MQRVNDDIDRIILDSFEEPCFNEIAEKSYNEKLLNKLYGNKELKGKHKTAAISLIAAGFLLMFIYSSGMQYNLTNIECKIRTDFSIVKNSIDFFSKYNIDKYLLGE